jgi:ABC-type dipeptide/oligopeptide/nickel transport system permease component
VNSPLRESVRFIARRLGITALTLFFSSLATFAAFALVPGDPAILSLGIEAPPEQVAALRAEMGLDRSLPVRYLSWLSGFLTGNMGNSTRFHGEPIAAMIRERLPVTAALALFSLVLILLIALPVSFLTVRREGGVVDRVTNALTAVHISFPGFFLGVLFIWLFGVILKIFVPGGYVPYSISIPGFAGSLFFPALVTAIPSAAVMVKFLRASLFREL